MCKASDARIKLEELRDARMAELRALPPDHWHSAGCVIWAKYREEEWALKKAIHVARNCQCDECRIQRVFEEMCAK